MGESDRLALAVAPAHTSINAAKQPTTRMGMTSRGPVRRRFIGRLLAESAANPAAEKGWDHGRFGTTPQIGSITMVSLLNSIA
jgi:hypothetical protein